MSDPGSKILIVEDDISSQQYYSVIFEGKYEISLVDNVAEAKQLLKSHDYGVAIVDISLIGGENGIDLIKYMSQEYRQNPIPICLTAHAFEQNRADALGAGAAEFFTKPIMSDTLLDVVDKYMKRIN